MPALQRGRCGAGAGVTSVQIGSATLHHGDCRDILPNVRGDVVLTDPPYGVSIAGSTFKRPNGQGTRRLDLLKNDSDWNAMEDLAVNALSKAIESKPLTVLCWCGHRQIGVLVKLLELKRYKTKLLFWHKFYPPPAPLNTGFASSVECCLYGYRPGFIFNGGICEHNVFECDNYRHGQPGKVDHPTQKPLQLIKWQVGLLTKPTDVVLDPFMGSGTTGVACAELGRPFIGIELEQKYFDIACERIAAAERQADLFVSKPRAATMEKLAL